MKKLNNNSGFTIIELILSFVFVFTLAFSTYEIIFNYKEKRDQESYRTQMNDYKNEVTLAIQKDITERTLNNIDYCYNNAKLIEKCLVLSFNDGTKKQLSIESTPKEYDGETKNVNYIKYGEIKYEPDESFLVKFPSNYMLYNTVETDEVGTNVTIYKIAIPIRHNELGNEDFGVYVNVIGYNYKEPAPEETPGVVDPPVEPVSLEGLKTTCTTRIRESHDVSQQTMIVRYRTDRFNTLLGSHVVSNLQLAGSGIAIDSSKKVCYITYTRLLLVNLPIYLCGNVTQKTGEWYTVVATFSKNGESATERLYVNGVREAHDTYYYSEIPENGLVPYAVAYEPGLLLNFAFFEGTISDVIILNGYALSEGEAQAVSSNLNANRNIINSHNDSVRLNLDFSKPDTYSTHCRE